MTKQQNSTTGEQNHITSHWAQITEQRNDKTDDKTTKLHNIIA